MRAALRAHWPEYLIEAAGLGLFMVSAGAFTALLFHPASPLAAWLPDGVARRILGGVAMGATAVALIYSPMGQRSGAHFNPAVTLTFLRLGKVQPWDAAFYVAAHFAGGAAGLLVFAAVAGSVLGHPAVNYVTTVPGPRGAGVAFAAEALISLGLMAVVLTVSNAGRAARFTGLCAGALVATYIAVEAPLSGMSMNPARTFASALAAHLYTSFWVYLTAPPLGMLLAAEIHSRVGRREVRCAKLHHDNARRCIFRCGWMQGAPAEG
jgi:aquaporin Z